MLFSFCKMGMKTQKGTDQLTLGKYFESYNSYVIVRYYFENNKF